MDSQLFTRINDDILLLRGILPRVARALGRDDELARNPGWREVLSIPGQILLRQGRPILVACLAGPSGAGKSALFRLLTGLDVPAGSAVRPVSYNTALAVPAPVMDETTIRALMPGYPHLTLLKTPDQIRDRKTDAGTLFYAPYPVESTALLWPVIADIPDFNTVEQSNWEKADKMIARADVVLFLTQADNYLDDRVVQVLHRCCKYAGRMAYVITKVQGDDDPGVRANAEQIWSNLCAHAGQDLERFREENRADGTPICDFLRSSKVFYAPFRSGRDGERLSLDDFRGLPESQGAIRDLIAGWEAADILLDRISQLALGGIELADSWCAAAKNEALAMEEKLRAADEPIRELSQRIAKSEFPIGRLLELLMETVRESRPKWIKRLGLPLSFAGRNAFKLGRYLSSWGRRLRGRPSTAEVRDRESLERKRLEEGTEWILDKWRAQFPGEAKAGLSAHLCSDRRQAFLRQPIPQAGHEWEKYLQDEVRAWVRAHPWKTTVAGSFSDILFALGGTLMVIDLAATGGGGTSWLVLALEHLGLYGGGGMAVSFVIKLFEEWGMGAQLRRANEQWEAQRSGEMHAHIRGGFAGPLFMDAWTAQLEQIRAAPLAECETACVDLKSALTERSRR